MAKSPRPADVSPDRDDRTEPMDIQSGPDPDRIAQRAYERYTERGREEGRDQEDWFEAERELRERSSGSATRVTGRDRDSNDAA
jgi:hypothetical protein